MKNALKLAFVFIGIIVGAGFASGQEIRLFFVTQGADSWKGVLLCGVLFGVVAFRVADKARTGGSFFGDGAFAKTISFITTLFMLCSYVAMTAAAGAVFQEFWGLPKWTGILAFSLVCFWVFARDVRGIVGLSSVLTPIIVAGTVAVAIGFFLNNRVTLTSGGEVNWLGNSIIYVSFNVLTCVPVLGAMGEFVKTKTTAILTGIISGVSLSAVAMMMWGILWHSEHAVAGAELPMMAALDSGAKMIYVPIMLAAMLTTAAASGFGVLRASENFLKGKSGALTFCAMGAAMSFLGFSAIVSWGYTAFGYAGLAALAFILGDIGRIREKIRKKELYFRKIAKNDVC